MYGTGDLDALGVKIAWDQEGPPLDPDAVLPPATGGRERLTRGYVADRFPALADAPLTGSKTCRYELSTDGHFIARPTPSTSTSGSSAAARPRLQARPGDGRADRDGLGRRRPAPAPLRPRPEPGGVAAERRLEALTDEPGRKIGIAGAVPPARRPPQHPPSNVPPRPHANPPTACPRRAAGRGRLPRRPSYAARWTSSERPGVLEQRRLQRLVVHRRRRVVEREQRGPSITVPWTSPILAVGAKCFSA